MDIDSIRDYFPVTKRYVYLNHASTAPLNTLSTEKLEEYLRCLRDKGDPEWSYLQSISESTRQKVADLLKTNKDNIAFVSNTSHGINIIIDSIPWKEGDEVLIPQRNFPANVYPWLYNKYGVAVKFVDGDFTENFRKCITGKTKLIAFDWVNYFTGERVDPLPIVEFAKSRGIYVLVDAIQGLGAVPLYPDRIGVDFVVSGTAKWLLGPQGLGILYVNPERLSDLKFTSIGWLSAPWKDFSDFSILPEPFGEIKRIECGTKNYAALSLFNGSLDIILRWGIEEMWNRISYYTKILFSELKRRGFEILTPEELDRRAGIVTFRKEGDMKELHERLKNSNIITSLRNNAIRISPHFYNTKEEIEFLLSKLY